MPVRIPCECCNKLYESHLMVICSVCKRKFMHTCVSLTTNEVRSLNGNRGYDWTCSSCRAMGNDIKDLKALIIQLQNEIKDLRNENAQMNQNRITSGIDFEELLSEFTERHKRRNNIVIFKVEEPNQNESLEEQKANDKHTVTAILNAIAPDLSMQNIRPIRLGAFNESKIRPIKVILDNDATVRSILKNSKRLKSNSTYKQINIAPDRTKKQIEYFKKVKQELDNRISNGDANIRIKYVNDVPKIVPKVIPLNQNGPTA